MSVLESIKQLRNVPFLNNLLRPVTLPDRSLDELAAAAGVAHSIDDRATNRAVAKC